MVIRWITRDPGKMERIRRRFGIPAYTTLNGLSPCTVREEDMEVFRETARRGFFAVMPLKWCKNGGTFYFISR